MELLLPYWVRVPQSKGPLGKLPQGGGVKNDAADVLTPTRID